MPYLSEKEAAEIAAALEAAGRNDLAALLIPRTALAHAVERYRQLGYALTTDGTGAAMMALAELGLELSESTAYRAWHKVYRLDP